MTVRRTFYVLDGLRGIAAIAVVSIHANEVLQTGGLPSSYLAVDLFFILSGFVVSHAYDARFRRGLSIFAFAATRLIRLYPLYVLGTTLGLINAYCITLFHLSGVAQSSLIGATMTSLVMLPSPQFGPVPFLFPFNPPAWSLFCEIFINFLYAASWRWLNKYTIAMEVLLSGIMILVIAFHYRSLNRGAMDADLFWGLTRSGFGFGLGIALQRIVSNGRYKTSRLAMLVPLALIPIFNANPHGLYRALFDTTCVLIVFPAIIVSAIKVEPIDSLKPIFNFFGATSYALYAIHYPLLVCVKGAFVAFHVDTASLPWFDAVFLPTCLLLAWAANRWFDIPLREWLTNCVHPNSSKQVLLKT